MLNKRIRALNNPRPVPMKALRPGVVVWAEVPFDDGSASKGRPAVVVDMHERTVEVLPITSSPGRRRRPAQHLELIGWAEAGLTRPSAVRRLPSRVALLSVSEILGKLTNRDAEAVLGGSHVAAA